MRSTRLTKRTPTIIDFHSIYLILEFRQDIIKRECASIGALSLVWQYVDNFRDLYTS